MLVLQNKSNFEFRNESLYISNFVPKNEFYAALLKIKPVSYIGLTGVDNILVENFIENLREFRLHFRIEKFEDGYILIYSYSKKYLKLFIDFLLKEENVSRYRIGLLLGYPKCCINNHINCVEKQDIFLIILNV